MADLGLCCREGFSLVAVCGLLTGGFSCCRAPALGARASAVEAHGLSSCSSRAPGHRLNRNSARVWLPCGMWDLPRSGIEPVSPALAGGFLYHWAISEAPWNHSFNRAKNQNWCSHFHWGKPQLQWPLPKTRLEQDLLNTFANCCLYLSLFYQIYVIWCICFHLPLAGKMVIQKWFGPVAEMCFKSGNSFLSQQTMS